MGIKTTINGGNGSGRGDNPHFTQIRYEAPGRGEAAFDVPRTAMSGPKGVTQVYKDWRKGSNVSGTNQYGQSMSPDDARKQALTRASGASGFRMVKDAYGRPV